jgi:type VI protein secretion system component VasF
MTLLELIEPLTQYVCRLNRSARKGGNFEHAPVRAEVEALFSEAQSKAASDPALAAQMDKDRGKIELILAFFVDFMIKESKLSFAAEWEEIAASKFNELSGDEKFWDLLEEALAERGDAADERLAVYYTFMGLGFTGWYTGQPEYLRKKAMECSARLGKMIDRDEKTPILGDSDLYVNNDDLIEPPGKSLLGIAVATGILIVVLLVGNIYLYYRGTSDLSGSLQDIVDMQSSQADPGLTPPPAGG